MVEYMPPTSDTKADPTEWTDKVSFESFTGAPLPDPIELVTSIADDQRKTCDKFEDHNTFSGLENGYQTSVRLFVCSVNPLTNKGQLTLVKTIRGDSNFYVITRARRVAPIEMNGEMPIPPTTMAEWSLYLRAISACNPADPAHPCPTNAAAPAPPESQATPTPESE